jgi:hypothetical protein
MSIEAGYAVQKSQLLAAIDKAVENGQDCPRVSGTLCVCECWVVQDKRATNLSAGRGVAVGEFPLKSGHGEADYLLFVDAAPIGVVELIETVGREEGKQDTARKLPARPARWVYTRISGKTL